MPSDIRKNKNDKCFTICKEKDFTQIPDDIKTLPAKIPVLKNYEQKLTVGDKVTISVKKCKMVIIISLEE